MPTATHRLRIRRLDTIGFVDKGDDPLAEIVFLKRLHGDDDLHKRIIARGNKFIVMSDDGSKVLGTHDTRAGAERQLAAVETNKETRHPMEKGKLGSIVQRAREAKGMSQEALGSKIGVTAGTVGAIESGEISVPPRVRLRRIASALGISLSSLEAAASDKDRLDRPPPPNAGKLLKFLRAIGLRVGMPEDDIEKLLAEGAPGSDDDKGSDKGGDMPFDIEKLGDEDRAEFEKLQKALADATDKVEELEKDADDGDDKLNTDDLPEPVAKALEDFEKRTKEAEDRAKAAEESVSKLVDERDREKYIRLAKTIGLVPDDDAETLRKIAGALESEDFDKFTAKITAMSKQAAEGGLYGEIGKAGEINGDEAESEVAELTKAYCAANPGTTDELARGKVFKSRPDLRRAVDARSNNNAEG